MSDDIKWTFKSPRATIRTLGYLPSFLSERNPQPAKEQLANGYRHGGGWHNFPGFALLPSGQIKYPGDEPLELIAECKLRDETVRVYEHDWVMILQPNGDFEICRMD